jgi:hypothetical protein
MTNRILLACTALCACSAPAVRVGASDGIPPIQGSSNFSLDTFSCGQTITTQDGYTVTSTVVSGSTDCQISFDNDVQLLKPSDYQNIPELKGASNLVQGVELQVNKLAFTDTTTNMMLDLNTQVKSATLSVNGQQVADKSVLASLPTTVDLSGAALTQLKTAVDARTALTVHVTSVIVVTQPIPKQLKVDYDAQPTIIVGAGQITLPGSG